VKISGGMQEQGVVVGNAYDKYNARNPLARQIMAGFHRALDELVGEVAPHSIHEVGCGEGFWVMHWLRQGIDARGSDFSAQVIDLARMNASEEGLPAEVFSRRSIYDLRAGEDSADLLVCCEVLEHLEDPGAGLEALQAVVRGQLILSVPREPLWRLLNMARGKYLGDWGNTPGHLQHWSRARFTDLVSGYFDIVRVRAPLPWTMLLCRRRGAA
jgi:2-polyprenyl-3-methyl-5-hydroxy-6-metoxy-1,4-benzoquinol methylase